MTDEAKKFSDAFTKFFDGLLSHRELVKVVEGKREVLLTIPSSVGLKKAEARWHTWCGANASFVEFLQEFYDAKPTEIQVETYVVGEEGEGKEGEGEENSE